MPFSDKNRTLKKNLEAGQRPTTRHWFLLDFSLPHYQTGRWAIVFPSSFMINFIIVNIWPIYQSLDKRNWFTILFFHLKVGCTLFQKLIFFAKLWLILSQVELSRTELPKCTPSILIENCDPTICPVLSILYLTQRVSLPYQNASDPKTIRSFWLKD